MVDNLKKVIVSITLLVAGLGYLSINNELFSGKIPTTKTQVRKIVTQSAPTYEFEFKNDTTGEIVVQQVTQAEYETWLQGTMTVPNYPQPTMKGHTWVKGSGGKVIETITEPILKTGEYIVIQEATATNTPLYKTVDGIVTSI